MHGTVGGIGCAARGCAAVLRWRTSSRRASRRGVRVPLKRASGCTSGCARVCEHSGQSGDQGSSPACARTRVCVIVRADPIKHACDACHACPACRLQLLSAWPPCCLWAWCCSCCQTLVRRRPALSPSPPSTPFPKAALTQALLQQRWLPRRCRAWRQPWPLWPGSMRWQAARSWGPGTWLECRCAPLLLMRMG